MDLIFKFNFQIVEPFTAHYVFALGVFGSWVVHIGSSRFVKIWTPLSFYHLILEICIQIYCNIPEMFGMENFIFKTLALPLECFCMTLLLKTNLPRDDRVLMVPKESCCITILASRSLHCQLYLLALSTINIQW